MFLETGTHADIFGWYFSDSNQQTINNDEISLIPSIRSGLLRH